jgi:hypothetical protein
VTSGSEKGRPGHPQRGSWLCRPGTHAVGGGRRKPQYGRPVELAKREGEAPTALPVEGATQAPIIDSDLTFAIDQVNFGG